MMTQPDRDVFARRWADAIVGTSDVSWGRDELVAYLVAVTDQLVEAVLVAEFEPLAGRPIGRELSLAHSVGTDTLSKTLALIIEWLPDLLSPYLPGVDVANRVAQLTGEIAAGYVSAVRERDLEEPDTSSHAGSRNRTGDPVLVDKAESGQVGDVSVGIAITEPGGRIVQITPSLEHILGYSPGELSGHQLHELFSSEEWPLVQQRYQGLVTGRDTRFQVRFLLRRADGDTVWVRLSASVLNASGLSGAPHPLHLVTIVDDITELELLQ